MSYAINGNKTSILPIRSVIILVKLCYHSYDYRPYRTPLCPITITKSKNMCKWWRRAWNWKRTAHRSTCFYFRTIGFECGISFCCKLVSLSFSYACVTCCNICGNHWRFLLSMNPTRPKAKFKLMTNTSHIRFIYLLLTEFEVRTASYGPSFLSFWFT